MKKIIKDKFQCPECGYELFWNVTNEDTNEIYKANIDCLKCRRRYYVNDGIIDFLNQSCVAEGKKEGVVTRLKEFFIENPDKKVQLYSSDEEKMVAADLWAKYLLLKDNGEIEKANKLLEIVKSKVYTKESMTVLEKMMNSLIELLDEREVYVLDIASGYCNMAIRILQNTNKNVIVTDNNIEALIEGRSKVREMNLESRIDFVVCDLRKSPFKDNAFEELTTLVGLQNISYPQNVVSELRRVCHHKFYSLSTFCKKDDKINLFALRKEELRDVWEKDRYKALFKKNNWKVDFVYSEYAKVSVPKYGDIIKWMRIDRFPIVETELEYTICISY